MRLQGDTNERVVYLDNLEAMCKQVSGMAHRFWVEKVTRARVYVAYSNPDEYGNENAFLAVFPLIPANAGDENRDNPRVVLTIMDTKYEPSNHHGEGWQCFQLLMDCPVLWRNPETKQWMTQETIFCDYEDCDQTVDVEGNPLCVPQGRRE